MRTLGELISTTRKKQQLSIDQLSEATQIAPKFLEAIEENAFTKLPSPLAAQGFLTSIACQLSLSAPMLLAMYRRDVVPEALNPATSAVAFRRLTRRTAQQIFAVLMLVSLCIVVGYAGFLLYRSRQAPPLRVLSPKTGAVLVSPVLVRGTSASDAVVMVDGNAVGVSQDGSFSVEQELFPGPHIITVSATGRSGKEAIETIAITIEPSE